MSLIDMNEQIEKWFDAIIKENPHMVPAMDEARVQLGEGGVTLFKAGIVLGYHAGANRTANAQKKVEQ